MTFATLRAGQALVLGGREVVVRAVEPCGLITDVQFYDDEPGVWHTFASGDLAPLN